MGSWSIATSIGNAFCIILSSYIMVDTCTNKRHNIVQYIGKMMLIILLLIIIAIRSSG